MRSLTDGLPAPSPTIPSRWSEPEVPARGGTTGVIRSERLQLVAAKPADDVLRVASTALDPVGAV